MVKNCPSQNQLERQGGRGEGCIYPSVTFEIVVLHIEEEAMLLLVFYYYFYLRFSLSLSRFQPIFVSFDAFSSLLYHCFKAMLWLELTLTGPR